jgi:paraquat-inducible protein B
MSKKANPTVIGAFVVGAVALLAVGVSLFGGAELFARKSTAIAFFPGSVKGLRVGSNVLFRGVRVGFVRGIQLIGDVDSLETLVRAEMEITPGVWRFTRQGKMLPEDAIEMIDEADFEKAGLRARLSTESFVTGQLLIELDFNPDTEPVFRALNERDREDEIPTIPSNVEQIVENIQEFVSALQEKVDFERVAEDFQGIMDGLNELANSQELRDAIIGLESFANSDATQQLPGNLQATLDDVRVASQNVTKLVNNLNEDVDPIAAQLGEAIAKLDGALGEAQSALANINRQVSGETGLEYEVTTALREIREAARALRNFVTYLEKNPEALLRGKRDR